MKSSLIETRRISQKTILALFTIILILAGTILPATKGEAKRIIKPNGVYAVIRGRPAHLSDNYVQIEIFSSFYCGHCYSLFKQENALRKRHKIKFVHIPIQWGNGSTKATEAYLIAKEMGKGNEMRTKLFEAKYLKMKDISDIGFLKKTASSLGLGKKFGQILEAGTKTKEIADNFVMASRLSINTTPTVIIGGNIIIVPRMTGGNINVFIMNIDTIVDSLLSFSSSRKDI